ncbi:MAG: hypothetical protein MZW92_08020 [Comamonadaceae bacterium]|nr:hypothetical protein [Comamonadaceae bacterium]
MLVSLFAVEWLYPILFEVYGGGDAGQANERAGGAARRRHAGGLECLGGAQYRALRRFSSTVLCCWLRRDAARRRSAGAWGTWRRERWWPHPAVRPPAAVAPVVGEAPAVSLNIAEQRAIVDYARRADRLTPERAEELALLAGPLTAGLGGTAARKRLLSYGAFLLGRE